MRIHKNIPSIQKLIYVKPVAVAHTCNFSIWEPETGVSLGQGQHGLFNETLS